MSNAGGHSGEVAFEFARCAVERAVAFRSSDEVQRGAVMAAADAALVEARAALTASLDEPTALTVIAARAGLTAAETELLVVAVGVESSEYLQSLVVSLTGDRNRHLLEIGMIPDLLGDDHPGTSVVGPEGALPRSAYVDVQQSGAFSRSILRLAPRLLWAINGDPMTDEDLPVATEFVAVPNVSDAPYDAVIVSGRDRVRRHQAAAAALGRSFAMIVRPPAGAEVEAAWAAIVREATLNATSVVIEIDGVLDATGRRWVERANHLPWALSSAAPLDLRQAPRLNWRLLEAADDEPSDEEWKEVLGEEVPRQHRLSADQLDQMRLAMPAHGGDFAAAFRAMVSPKLEKLASHVRPRHGWDDLILDPLRKAQLGDLVNRYRNAHQVYDEWGVPAVPSRGLVALFSGPSGTGKTLGAEVVAGELGLDLYKLDLSSVVSKWIGETEKNLDELFAAAGAGNFVLFFDEADALFAKRGAVNDSHDRYANVETSYLLQRLERYDGVVIMATNYEKNIDEAFMRRIHVRVDFAMPDAAARKSIWQRHTESAAGLGDDVDFDWLSAQFEIPGAAIKNATVDAAFLAAADGKQIEMVYLVRGLARELRKLGRLITREQFGPWFAAVSPLTGLA